MKLNILKTYGLHSNDLQIYEVLLKLGRSKTGPIIRESGISSSRVYESLQLLVNLGLASYQVKNNIKFYQPLPPHQLLEEAGRNIKEPEKLTKEVVRVPAPLPSRNEANIFEGRHGFKMAFNQHIARMKKGEQISIIGFSRRSFVRSGTKEMRTFFRNTDVAMMPKRCDARLLTESGMQEILKTDRIDPSIYQLRFLPAGYFGPCAVNISSTEVLLSIWGEKPLVFSIKNPVMVKSFQKNFDFLWNLAKEK